MVVMSLTGFVKYGSNCFGVGRVVVRLSVFAWTPQAGQSPVGPRLVPQQLLQTMWEHVVRSMQKEASGIGRREQQKQQNQLRSGAAGVVDFDGVFTGARDTDEGAAMAIHC